MSQREPVAALLCRSYFQVPALTTLSDGLEPGNISQMEPTSFHVAYNQCFLSQQKKTRKIFLGTRELGGSIKVQNIHDFSWKVPLCLQEFCAQLHFCCPVPVVTKGTIYYHGNDLCGNYCRHVLQRVSTQSLRWQNIQFKNVSLLDLTFCAWQRVSWFGINWTFLVGVLIMERYYVHNHEEEADEDSGGVRTNRISTWG